MATVNDSSQVTETLTKFNNDTKIHDVQNVDNLECHNSKYGLPLLDVYKLALGFYKGNV